MPNARPPSRLFVTSETWAVETALLAMTRGEVLETVATLGPAGVRAAVDADPDGVVIHGLYAMRLRRDDWPALLLTVAVRGLPTLVSVSSVGGKTLVYAYPNGAPNPERLVSLAGAWAGPPAVPPG